MCHPRSLTFFSDHIKPEQVRGKRVLEVGSYNVNGSMRDVIVPMGPREYIGVDLRPGPGVDVVMDFSEISDIGGGRLMSPAWSLGSFDFVICIAMLEHCPKWTDAFVNLKNALIPGGIIHFSVPTPGFSYHEALDCWRWTPEQVRAMFADFQIIAEEVTPSEADPGGPHLIQIIARKPPVVDLDAIQPMAMVQP